MGLYGTTLHQEHHIKQEATLPESHQAVQQAAEVGGTPEGLSALAAGGSGAPSHWTQLSVFSHGRKLVLRLHGVYLTSINVILTLYIIGDLPKKKEAKIRKARGCQANS